jgi:TrkA domain protein
MNRREPRLLHDNVTEQILPGIGRRYDMAIEDGHLATVIHHSGRRDLYLLAKPDAEPSSVLTLSDMEARTLGAVLGGAYFKPAVVEEMESVIGDLLIDWVTLAEDAPGANKSIAELEIRGRTRMTVAAIVRSHMPIVAPEPDEVLRPGDRLIVVGRREDLAGFIRHVVGEPVG